MKSKNYFLSTLLGASLFIANFANAQFVSGGAGKTVLTNINDFVGIGTSNPLYKVDIQGSGISTMQFKSSNNNASILLDRGSSGSTASLTYKTSGSGNWQTGIITNDNYSIRNNGLAAPAVTILFANNNVGIGTANPTQKLNVAGNILATGNVDAVNVTASGTLTASTVTSTGNISGVNITGTGNIEVTGYIGFNSVEQFTDGGANTIAANSNLVPTVDCGANLGISNKRWNNILACGNVGIGIAAPVTKLQVVGGADANLLTGGYLILGDITGLSTTFDNNEIMARNNGVVSELTLNRLGGNVIINGTGSGNVGIGNAVPAFQLQLSLNSAAKPTSSAWTVPSDARLKKDVRVFTDGLDVLNKINPVWFTYTGEAGMPANDIGVGTIAQELQKVAPYMVNEWTYKNEKKNTEQKYLGVDYGALDFIMINCIKAQQKQIDELKNALTQMQNDLSQCCMSFKEAGGNEQWAKGKGQEANSTDLPSLLQNAPNPFSQSTIIKFYIPQNFKSVQVKIYSSSGEEMKSFDIGTPGIGQVEIVGNTMAPGIYNYTLMIDGKAIDNKQMVLTK